MFGDGKMETRLCPFLSANHLETCAETCMFYLSEKRSCALISKSNDFPTLNFDDFGMLIKKMDNGYLIIMADDNKFLQFVYEENDFNEKSRVDTMVKLLYDVLGYFYLESKYDRDRIRIITEVGEKYSLKENEKLVSKMYVKVEKNEKEKE